jgi:benzoate-CoA ligase
LGAVNAAVELLTLNMEDNPDKTAYFCGDDSLSFRGLDRACRSFACQLRQNGIAPGDRVLIVLPDCLAFPVAFLGCLLCGSVAVAVNADLREEEFNHIVRDCGARLLVAGAEFARHFSLPGKIEAIIRADDGLSQADSAASPDFAAPYQPSNDDIAYMLYSSGSTGLPKGVPHRHKSLLLPCELMGKAVLGITGEDIVFSTSKLSFAYGLINSLAFPLAFGASAILHPGKPSPREILDIIRRHRPTVFFSVPTVYSQLILSCAEPQQDLPMRLCCSAGEALPAAVFEEWRRLTGLEIIDSIGSTEMAYGFISNVPGKAVAGSAGRPVPGYRVRLVDDSGNVVPAGNEGNLLVRGETACPFYWNLPEKSAETMLPDGYMRTGDVFVEKDGFYYHRGRSDDMIKADARWISPVAVEEVLRSHPAVADCAVAAVAVGSLVKPGAFVVPAPGTERTADLARELRAFAMARLPDYMCPVRFRFLEELPRTSTGKVQRFRLGA